MRDFYECQYCASKESLTIDHVVPKSKGGKDTWENLVTACQKCNSRKGNRTPDEADMKLRKIPKQPY
jgi:5-methylcytosine-specific restriction endonuclease McrA